MNVDNPEVTVIPNNHRDSQSTDSDSDGPILYKDDTEEEDDDEEDEFTSSVYFATISVENVIFSIVLIIRLLVFKQS